jgi:cardiolipin synthase
MWLANLLTLTRIPLAIDFWVTYGDPEWSLIILAVAAVTDALDGRVARWAKARAARQGVRVSTAGEWLDPLADKFFVLMVLGAITVHEHTPLIVVTAILARELVIVPLGVIYRLVLMNRPRVEHAFQADSIGKATTIAQLVAVAGLVAHARWAVPVAMAAGVLGIGAALHYVFRAAAKPASQPA